MKTMEKSYRQWTRGEMGRVLPLHVFSLILLEIAHKEYAMGNNDKNLEQARRSIRELEQQLAAVQNSKREVGERERNNNCMPVLFS